MAGQPAARPAGDGPAGRVLGGPVRRTGCVADLRRDLGIPARSAQRALSAAQWRQHPDILAIRSHLRHARTGHGGSAVPLLQRHEFPGRQPVRRLAGRHHAVLPATDRSRLGRPRGGGVLHRLVRCATAGRVRFHGFCAPLPRLRGADRDIPARGGAMASNAVRSGFASGPPMVPAILAGRLLRIRDPDLRAADVRLRHVGHAGLRLPAVRAGLCRPGLRDHPLSAVRPGGMVGARRDLDVQHRASRAAGHGFPAGAASFTRPLDRPRPAGMRPGLAAAARSALGTVRRARRQGCAWIFPAHRRRRLPE